VYLFLFCPNILFQQYCPTKTGATTIFNGKAHIETKKLSELPQYSKNMKGEFYFQATSSLTSPSPNHAMFRQFFSYDSGEMPSSLSKQRIEICSFVMGRGLLLWQ